MLFLKHTSSSASEEKERGPVATGQSNASKRLQRRTSDKYVEHIIVQRCCSRGPTFTLKQKICRPAQEIDRDALEGSLGNSPLIRAKQRVFAFAVKLLTRETTGKACKR